MRLLTVDIKPQVPIKGLIYSPHGGVSIPLEIVKYFLKGRMDTNSYYRILQWIYEDGDRGTKDFYSLLREHSRVNISTLLARVFIDHNRLIDTIVLSDSRELRSILSNYDSGVKDMTMFLEWIFKYPLSYEEKLILCRKYLFPVEREIIKIVSQERENINYVLHCHTMPPETTESLTASKNAPIERPLISIGDGGGKIPHSFPKDFVLHLQKVLEIELSKIDIAKVKKKYTSPQRIIRRHGLYVPHEKKVAINAPYNGSVSMKGFSPALEIAGITPASLLFEINRDLLQNLEWISIIQRAMLLVGKEIQKNYGLS